MKRLITALLCIVLCLGMMVPAMATNSLGVVFKATLNTETLNASESEQTVSLKIAGTTTFEADSFEYKVEFPAGWTAVSIVSEDIAFKGKDYNLAYESNVAMLFWDGNDDGDNVTISDLGTITFTVPANTAAGDYTFRVYDFNVMKDYGTKWETGSELTATLTITGGADAASTGAKLDKETASVTVGGTVTLTPSLLPTGTAATVSSVTWSSSNTNVATVTDGVVKGVAQGTAVITALVTPSDNASAEYEAKCTVTVTESPYTVSVVRADGSTDPVHPGNEVTMNIVVSGDAYVGLETTLTYDTTLFEYTSASGDATVTPGSGSIEIYLNDVNSPKANGSAAAALTFTAKAPSGDSAEGTFGLSYAKACNVTSALNGTGPSARGADVKVTIVNQVTVKFLNKEGTLLSEVVIDAGGKVTDVPNAPAVDYFDFAGWSDGKTTYSDAAAVKAVAFSKDTTFTATYTEKTYGVTLQNGLTGTDEATYNKPYTVTVTDYDSDYVYTVTYTAAGGEKKTATDNGNGTFTIPGADITGALNVTFTKKLSATVNVHPDYVDGYTLVTVASSGTKAYRYGENTMYFIKEKSEYAWLVAGKVTKAEAEALVDEATTAAVTITFSSDVNGDGHVDIDDAVVVNAVLNKLYDVDANMAVYLRANVNAYDSYKIDAADINAIITDSTYEK